MARSVELPVPASRVVRVSLVLSVLLRPEVRTGRSLPVGSGHSAGLEKQPPGTRSFLDSYWVFSSS